METTNLLTRIANVQERIATATRRAGRAPKEITLVAVSKGHDAAAVVQAHAAGLCIFGENRVEEAGPKAAAVAAQSADDAPIAWHMIGHLQSRKAADVLPWASMVHSVDSVKLARRLSQLSAAAGRELPILLEVNLSGEASKYGFTPEEVLRVAGNLVTLPALRIQGIMTMAPIAEDPETVRPVFAGMRKLLTELAHLYPSADWRHLSMGMTDDFEIAISEGATMVRIGRAIFGDKL